VYHHFQNGPLVSNLEQGTAQLYQAGRLSFVCTKLVGKQMLRVILKQVTRQGGAEKLALDICGMAVDQALHLIDTIGMAWNGMAWGITTVKDTVQQILEEQQEQRVVVQQELQ
jgi:hypothetical protein